MALAKQGYKSAIRGTAYVAVPMNDDGYIAESADTAVGTKNVQLTMVNAENSQATNQQIASLFFGFMPSTKAVANDRMRVIWEV